MVKFTVYPNEGQDDVEASFSDLGTTMEQWETLTEYQREKLIIDYMDKKRPVYWRLDTYNDNL